MAPSLRLKAYWAIERLLTEAREIERKTGMQAAAQEAIDLEDLYWEVKAILTKEDRQEASLYVVSKYTTEVTDTSVTFFYDRKQKTDC